MSGEQLAWEAETHSLEAKSIGELFHNGVTTRGQRRETRGKQKGLIYKLGRVVVQKMPTTKGRKHRSPRR